MNDPYDKNSFEVLRLDPRTPAEQVVEYAGGLRQRSGTEDELAAGRMPLRREFMAPNDYLHAGAVVSFADSLCGMGCIASMTRKARSLSTGGKSNAARRAPSGARWSREYLPLNRPLASGK